MSQRVGTVGGMWRDGWRERWREVVAAAFPLRCPGCGRPAEPICDSCRCSLLPAPHAAPPAGVDAWVAAFAYAGVARELVARVKYRRIRAAVPFLAAAMADALVATSVGGFDIVTWAPTTAARRRARGFDHAALLARAVGRELNLPARRLLGRQQGTAQTGLPAALRRAGPSFTPRGGVAGDVLLVDDVATTGATLARAADALRRAGARRIVALTAARTPRTPLTAASPPR